MSAASASPAFRNGALDLPARTLGLLARSWAPVAFWFVLGYLVHDLTLRGSAWLAGHNAWLGFAGLSVGVLVLLSSTIMMFHAVLPAPGAAGTHVPTGGGPLDVTAVLPRVLPLSPTGAPTPAESATSATSATSAHERGRMVDQIAEAILPFLIFYGAWGLFTDEVRTWGVHVVNSDIGQGLGILSGLGAATGVPLAIAVGSWLVRAVLERLYAQRGGRLLGVAVALFEANWMFFAVVSVSVVIGQAIDWVTGRVAWVATRDGIAGAFHAGTDWAFGWADGIWATLPLDQVGAAWHWLSAQFGDDVADGLVLPLLWLVIAAVVFGEQMDADERVVADSRLAGAGTLFQRLPAKAQLLSDLLTREIRDKWTPLVNGLRFVLRAGPVFYLTFCLLYVLIEASTGWAFIGVTHLIGPHPWQWWFPRLGPLEFAEQTVREVVRIALLAAAFEACRARAGAGRPDGRSAATAADATGATSAGTRGTPAPPPPPAPGFAGWSPPASVRRTP